MSGAGHDVGAVAARILAASHGGGAHGTLSLHTLTVKILEAAMTTHPAPPLAERS